MLRELTKADWQGILMLSDEQIPEALLLRGTRNLKWQCELPLGAARELERGRASAAWA